jgi:hypothetical protein
VTRDNVPLSKAELLQALADLDTIKRANCEIGFRDHLIAAQREQRDREMARTIGLEMYAHELALDLATMLGLSAADLVPLAWEHVFSGRRPAILAELRRYAAKLAESQRTAQPATKAKHHPAIAQATRQAAQQRPRRGRRSA